MALAVVFLVLGAGRLSIADGAHAVLSAADRETVSLQVGSVADDCVRGNCTYKAEGVWTDPRTGAEHRAEVANGYDVPPSGVLTVIASPSHPSEVVKPGQGAVHLYLGAGVLGAVGLGAVVVLVARLARQLRTPLPGRRR